MRRLTLQGNHPLFEQLPIVEDPRLQSPHTYRQVRFPRSKRKRIRKKWRKRKSNWALVEQDPQIFMVSLPYPYLLMHPDSARILRALHGIKQT